MAFSRLLSRLHWERLDDREEAEIPPSAVPTQPGTEGPQRDPFLGLQNISKQEPALFG